MKLKLPFKKGENQILKSALTRILLHMNQQKTQKREKIIVRIAGFSE